MIPAQSLFPTLIILISIGSLLYRRAQNRKNKERVTKLLHYIGGAVSKDSGFQLFQQYQVWATGTYRGKEVKLGQEQTKNRTACYAALKLKYGINSWKFVLKDVKPTAHTKILKDWIYICESSSYPDIFNEGRFPEVLEELYSGAQTAEAEPEKYHLNSPKKPQDDLMSSIIK